MKYQKKNTGGFLKNKEIQKIIDREKFEAWAEKYPFAAMMMSNRPYTEKLKYAEESFK